MRLDYRVYTESTAIPDEDQQRLAYRGHAQMRSREWLAIKHVWVREHMTNNDPSLTYVPAVREARSPRSETAS